MNTPKRYAPKKPDLFWYTLLCISVRYYFCILSYKGVILLTGDSGLFTKVLLTKLLGWGKLIVCTQRPELSEVWL